MSRRKTRSSRAATPGSPGFSPEPPVPVQESVAEKEGDQSHAAQKNAKRHLVVAVDHLRRLPSPPPRSLRIGQSLHKAVRALQPHHEDRRQTEKRSRKRRRKNRK